VLTFWPYVWHLDPGHTYDEHLVLILKTGCDKNHRRSRYSPVVGHLPLSSFTSCPPAPSMPPQRSLVRGHLPEPWAANHHHRTPSLTTVPLWPSCALVETAPPVSPPLRCASSHFATVPCSPSTPPRPTLPLVTTGIDRLPLPVPMGRALPCS
jgi:hypothetical protein